MLCIKSMLQSACTVAIKSTTYHKIGEYFMGQRLYRLGTGLGEAWNTAFKDGLALFTLISSSVFESVADPQALPLNAKTQ